MKGRKKISLKQDEIFALFRRPGESNYYLFRQTEKGSRQSFSKGNTGFLMHPFESGGIHPDIFISADIINKNPIIHFKPGFSKLPDSTSESVYMDMVKSFIKTTKTGPKKLVLSRVLKVTNNEEDLFDTFQKMNNTYPTAFVYIVNHPHSGCWMGATPEQFIVGDQNEYSTVALAGTKLNIEPFASENWSSKDIEEQQLVCRHIESILDVFETTYTKTGPTDQSAGKLLHIKTEYKFKKVSDLKKLADALHPTPAVCGLPKSMALEVILNQEKHDRAYYTGYLGPVNFKSEIALYVNLRCMKLSSESIVLFAGGGIIPQSVPNLEWNETEHKLQTMMDILKSR